MVSYEVGRRALSQILDTELHSFHQVLFYSDPTDDKPPLLYLCLSREELFLCDVQVTKKALSSEQELRNETEEQVEEHFPMIRLKYSQLSEVIIHSQAEDRFGIVLDPTLTQGDLPKVLHLSTCYRRDVVGAIQIQYSTYIILQTNTLTSLKVSFLGADVQNAEIAFRHPAVKMFYSIPKYLMDGRKVFYRRGYLFLLPQLALDRYDRLFDRPTSTYMYRSADKKKASDTRDPKQLKHLVVRFLPEKPISMSHEESELGFQLWTESIAYAVAELQSQSSQKDQIVDNNAYRDSYFVSERGVYQKRQNIVGDQASWSCFRIHMYTKEREIGVIGVRRKYVPPLLDTYQDMIFVMYGEIGAFPQPDFMSSLEQVVDSLSPASSALQTRAKIFFRRQTKSEHGFRTLQSPDALTTHPTYYDRVILQARADALYYNHELYSWLKFRNDITIVPRTRFIDLECNALADIFCKSVLESFPQPSKPHPDETYHDYDKTPNDKVSAVNDPLSVIYRMQSQSHQSSFSDTDEKEGLSADLDWNRRISRYFAFCIDGGWSRRWITIKKITDIATETRGIKDALHVQIIDRVLDFLLFLLPPGANHYSIEPPTNIIKRLKLCQTHDNAIDQDITFNEWVMVRLLETNYLEILQKSESEKKQDENNISIDVFSQLLKVLLSKSYNLELIQAVSMKIVRAVSGMANESEESKSKSIDVHLLIEPLFQLVKNGNMYVKQYALQALVALARVEEGGELILKKEDGMILDLAIQLLKVTKNPELIKITLKLLVAISNRVALDIPIQEESKNKNPLHQRDFISMLIDLLDFRMKTQERHSADVIGEVSQLLFNLSADKNVAKEMFDRDVVTKWIDIIKNDKNYNSAILRIIKALTRLFVLARDHAAMLTGGSVAESALDHSRTLVASLSKCEDRLRICVYILSALRQLIRMDLSNNKEDNKRRFNILKNLCTSDLAFERIFKNLRDNISKAENILDTHGDSSGSSGGGDDDDAPDRINAEELKRLKDLLAWFKSIIESATRNDWLFERFTEHQNAKKQKKPAAATGATGTTGATATAAAGGK